MTVALIVSLVALVVVGLALFAMFASRASRTTVAIGPSLTPPARIKVRPPDPPAGVHVHVRDPSDSSVESIVAPAPVPAPLFDIDLEPVIAPPPPVEIRWSRQFDARSATIDETARLRLIGDLGVIAKEWCVPLLCQAYEEEPRPSHRQAALIALAACRSRAASATFERALSSTDPGERAIAADGLADLEPPPPRPKARRPVERH